MNEHIEKAKCMKHMKEMHNGDKFCPLNDKEDTILN
jgi:hypothetical protein